MTDRPLIYGCASSKEEWSKDLRGETMIYSAIITFFPAALSPATHGPQLREPALSAQMAAAQCPDRFSCRAGCYRFLRINPLHHPGPLREHCGVSPAESCR